jgi:ketosteroid isomerase-like protein
MKIRLAVALAASAINFVWSASAQKPNTPDPKIIEQLDVLKNKTSEAFIKGDAIGLAALYTEDAVEVTDEGPIYGREAIEKHYADVFKQVHFSTKISKRDQYSPHIIGTAGDEEASNGEWSNTIQGQNFGPVEVKGYWSTICVRESDGWKYRMLTWNITPAPVAPVQTK